MMASKAHAQRVRQAQRLRIEIWPVRSTRRAVSGTPGAIDLRDGAYRTRGADLAALDPDHAFAGPAVTRVRELLLAVYSYSRSPSPG